MEWKRTSNQVIRAQVKGEKDFVICASRIDGVWVYCGFGPEVDVKRMMKVRYEQGEPVPERRAHLGCYRATGNSKDSAAVALGKAKQACEEHWENEHDHGNGNN